METTDRRFITLKQAEALTGRHNGTQVFWDNYDLIIWKPERSGYTRTNGMLRDGDWGIHERVRLNSRGRYSVPEFYAKRVGGGPRDKNSN